MKTFKMRELQVDAQCYKNVLIFLSLKFSEFLIFLLLMNAQKQKGQALNAASAQKAIDILKASAIYFFFD